VNLQLDHFSDDQNHKTPRANVRFCTYLLLTQPKSIYRRLSVCTCGWGFFPTARAALEHGSNNVSRWMTWLPISLKNAAKCDKWYQLQNHSITESLNAKGAWEKLFTSHPRACRISVSNNKKEALFV